MKEGERYLITTAEWFYGTDGQQYRAVWGKCKVIKFEDILGFLPQRPSTNWMMQVGEGEKQTTVAGCQIQYLVKCDNRPEQIEGNYIDSNGVSHNNNRIYFTE